MKTIYINGRFLTQRITGVQRYAIEIVKALDKYLDEDKDIQKKYKFIIIAPKNIKQKLILKNIDIKKFGFLKGHLWEQIELPLYVKNNFLFNFCNCAPLIKKNQAVTIHDAAVAAVPEAYSFCFRTWYKFMYYILGKHTNVIFTVSKFSKEELIKYFNIDRNKIFVTYNGIDHIKRINIDETIFTKLNIKKKSYILAVSSLNPSKNFKLVLETAKKMPDESFIIAGNKNNAVFKSKEFIVPKNVKFIGYVTDEELVALYKYANCFVYPSFYEGFGIPPLEALCCGCSVIVSNEASLPEICKDNVIYCSAKDVNSLVNKIKFSKNPSKKIYPDINEVINLYNWQSVMKYVLSFL